MLKILGILLVFLISCIFPQSLETQLKVIFGDFLQTNKNKNVRTLGKAISISGQMEYEFEKIKTESESTVNYNIKSGNPSSSTNPIYSKLPINVIFNDGVLVPIAGYEWVNPTNPNDYKVKDIQINTLMPYSIDTLESKWNNGFRKKIEVQHGKYTVKKDREYLNDIIENNNYFDYLVYKNNVFSKKEIKENYLIRKGRVLNVSKRKNEDYYNQLNQIFFCKWVNDFNNNGLLDFDEFKYRQRTYSVNESFEIYFSYTSNKPDTDDTFKLTSSLLPSFRFNCNSAS